MLVNRSDRDATICLASPRAGGAYDLWRGQPVSPADGELAVVVPAQGIGGVWFAPPGADASWLTARSPSLGISLLPTPVGDQAGAATRPAPSSPQQKHVVVPAR